MAEAEAQMALLHEVETDDEDEEVELHSIPSATKVGFDGAGAYKMEDLGVNDPPPSTPETVCDTVSDTEEDAIHAAADDGGEKIVPYQKSALSTTGTIDPEQAEAQLPPPSHAKAGKKKVTPFGRMTSTRRYRGTSKYNGMVNDDDSERTPLTTNVASGNDSEMLYVSNRDTTTTSEHDPAPFAENAVLAEGKKDEPVEGRYGGIPSESKGDGFNNISPEHNEQPAVPRGNENDSSLATSPATSQLSRRARSVKKGFLKRVRTYGAPSVSSVAATSTEDHRGLSETSEPPRNEPESHDEPVARLHVVVDDIIEEKKTRLQSQPNVQVVEDAKGGVFEVKVDDEKSVHDAIASGVVEDTDEVQVDEILDQNDEDSIEEKSPTPLPLLSSSLFAIGDSEGGKEQKDDVEDVQEKPSLPPPYPSSPLSRRARRIKKGLYKRVRSRQKKPIERDPQTDDDNVSLLLLDGSSAGRNEEGNNTAIPSTDREAETSPPELVALSLPTVLESVEGDREQHDADAENNVVKSVCNDEEDEVELRSVDEVDKALEIDSLPEVLLSIPESSTATSSGADITQQDQQTPNATSRVADFAIDENPEIQVVGSKEDEAAGVEVDVSHYEKVDTSSDRIESTAAGNPPSMEVGNKMLEKSHVSSSPHSPSNNEKEISPPSPKLSEADLPHGAALSALTLDRVRTSTLNAGDDIVLSVNENDKVIAAVGGDSPSDADVVGASSKGADVSTSKKKAKGIRFTSMSEQVPGCSGEAEIEGLPMSSPPTEDFPARTKAEEMFSLGAREKAEKEGNAFDNSQPEPDYAHEVAGSSEKVPGENAPTNEDTPTVSDSKEVESQTKDKQVNFDVFETALDGGDDITIFSTDERSNVMNVGAVEQKSDHGDVSDAQSDTGSVKAQKVIPLSKRSPSRITAKGFRFASLGGRRTKMGKEGVALDNSQPSPEFPDAGSVQSTSYAAKDDVSLGLKEDQSRKEKTVEQNVQPDVLKELSHLNETQRRSYAELQFIVLKDDGTLDVEETRERIKSQSSGWLKQFPDMCTILKDFSALEGGAKDTTDSESVEVGLKEFLGDAVSDGVSNGGGSLVQSQSEKKGSAKTKKGIFSFAAGKKKRWHRPIASGQEPLLQNQTQLSQVNTTVDDNRKPKGAFEPDLEKPPDELSVKSSHMLRSLSRNKRHASRTNRSTQSEPPDDASVTLDQVQQSLDTIERHASKRGVSRSELVKKLADEDDSVSSSDSHDHGEDDRAHMDYSYDESDDEDDEDDETQLSETVDSVLDVFDRAVENNVVEGFIASIAGSCHPEFLSGSRSRKTTSHRNVPHAHQDLVLRSRSNISREDVILRDDRLEEETKSSPSCNFDSNPTKLYGAIHLKRWRECIQRSNSNPKEAATWVVRKDRRGRMLWRLLPLHAAIITDAPGDAVEALLCAFPPGAQCKDDHGMLPIHHAMRNGAPVDVLDLLLAAYPQGVNIKDRKGRVPLTLAHASSSPNQESYSKALRRGPSYYVAAAAAVERAASYVQALERRTNSGGTSSGSVAQYSLNEGPKGMTSF